MAAKGEASLVKPPRTIAALEAELERCTAERDEALAREAATAKVLQVINSSPGDLTPVFDAILEKAHTLWGADFGTLMRYDGERFHPIAAHGASARFQEVMRDGFRPGHHDAFAELVRAAVAQRRPDCARRRSNERPHGFARCRRGDRHPHAADRAAA
jgi:hypothetical protein